MKIRPIFITGTDTGVGKTIATFVLATLFQQRGIDVGVMKPIQCGGNDAQFLKKALNLSDALKDINPFLAPEPLSPHLAFRRARKTISVSVIKEKAEVLRRRHDVLFIEGAGGLLVPIKKKYLVADLIKDLNADVVIVSRLGLGTINHTLLAIRQARELGLNVLGVIFSRNKKGNRGLPEKTNPAAIRQFGGVKILGTILLLSKLDSKSVIAKCRLDLRSILKNDSGLTADSRKLKVWDKKYVWHPFTQMKDWLESEPLIIERGQGTRLIDTEGRSYIDGVSSLWVNVHGHRHPTLDRALKDQINRLGHSTLLGLSNVPSIELAKQLVGIAPQGLEKVFYSDNGSTAVEVALKIAYQFWQNAGKYKKTKIMHLVNSYHGDTLGSVSVGGIDLFHHMYKKLIFPTIQADFSNYEEILRKKHAQIAAFVVEPLVQGAAGMIVWPDGILRRMRDLCRKYGVLLIADEVATGFGRTGKMFACEHEGVSPDILCLAKGLTGGYLPLAATLTTQRIFDGFIFDYKDQKTFFHGHTYTGNPLACAVALANIEIFKKEKTLAKLQPKIRHLSKRLAGFNKLDCVGEVRQKGFMVGIELVKNKATMEPFPWEDRIGVRVCQMARERGVILRPLGNVIVLMPPLSISIAELDELCDRVLWSIKGVRS